MGLGGAGDYSIEGGCLKSNKYWVLLQDGQYLEDLNKIAEVVDKVEVKQVKVDKHEPQKVNFSRNKLQSKNKPGIKENNVDKKLKCFYCNARSIVNKQEELELYIHEEEPDIVGITETWTVENVEDAEISIEGYTMFRRDRELGIKQRGGGVLLYIKIL
jgi:hypothetical protein